MNDTLRQVRSFFDSGKTRPVPARKAALRRLDACLARHEGAILAALEHDMRKPAFESLASEIAPVRDEIRLALKHLDRWARPRRVPTPLTIQPARTRVRRMPVGSVLVLGPWNYPFQLIMVPLVGAIAAGNVAALKPSEFAPATAKVIALIVGEAFQEEPWARVFAGEAELARTLLKEPWGHVFFTGSTAVGRDVMRLAAETLSPVTLELGGKSPCIVDETSDLATAAKRIAWGKFFNAGQTCIAPDYVLVPRVRKEIFLQHLSDAMRKAFGPDPRTSPDFARIIHDRHFAKLVSHLSEGRVVVGGAFDASERYVAPTVMDQVVDGSRLDTEEVFGPILPIYEYEHFDEALAFVAKRPDPLALYLFSSSRDAWEKVARAVRFGGGCLNDTLVHFANPHAPFGGIGASGMGAYHGERSFEMFSHHQTVVERPKGFDVPVRYPPYRGKLGLLRRLLRL